MKILVKNIHSLGDASLLLTGKPKYVDEKRWKKMQSMKSDEDKLRSVASGYLLHEMCKELDITELRYGYQDKGKPYMEDHENVAFNLSHSGEYAVLAYHEKASSIGIDIQKIRVLREGMKKRILHEKEEIPRGISKEEEVRYLNRIWAIKESYVKMTGDGLSLDFRKIYIDFEKNTVKAEGCENAHFTEYDDLEDYVMAVCTAESE